MDNVEIFVGIDVSKETLDVHVLEEGFSLSFENSHQGIRELAQELSPRSPTQVVMEATGGLERRVAAYLVEAGLEVVVVNPRQVRQYAKAKGILAKTDSVDARVLALFGRDIMPESRPLRTRQEEAIRALVARRNQLMGMRVAEMNRLSRAESPKVLKSIRSLVKTIERLIVAVDKEIDDTIGKSPIWRVTDDLLRSVRGVGKKTSRALLAALPEIGTLSCKEAASLGGLAPFANESGKSRGRRMIQGGRSSVRRALYMATLVAIQHNPDIREFYERLRGAGKPGKVAVTACMRKLLVTLNAVVARGTKWTPERA